MNIIHVISNLTITVAFITAILELVAIIIQVYRLWKERKKD